MFAVYSGYKLNNQTVLRELIDENYEPTEEEIYEYAVYIGIDPEKVNQLKRIERLIHMQLIGTGSSLVGQRRSYETITLWLEAVSRRKWRVVLF